MISIKEKLYAKDVKKMLPKMGLFGICVLTFVLIIISMTSNEWGKSNVYFETRGRFCSIESFLQKYEYNVSCKANM